MSNLNTEILNTHHNVKDQNVKVHPESNTPRTSRLWSTLAQVCELLRISTDESFPQDVQFQHMQFKAGQRIHMIGQPFDQLYIVFDVVQHILVHIDIVEHIFIDLVQQLGRFHQQRRA